MDTLVNNNPVSVANIHEAYARFKGVIAPTPLMANLNSSEEFNARVSFKREDLQLVRSYKIRGAFNKISSLNASELKNGVICASAGNHAQGVAWSCNKLKIKGRIYMPATTPNQKIKQVQLFGKEYAEVVLTGDTFDDAYTEALHYSEEHKITFVHPFNDEKVIAGQGTIGIEILEQTNAPIDYLFVPIGGGGLAAGLCTVFSELSPSTKIIGVEPAGAASMKTSIDNGYNTELGHIDKFVDGAAVKRVGDLTFNICKTHLHDMITVPEGKVCSTILRLYNEEAIVVEPAGALTIAALDLYKDHIVGKNVVCIVSGSNNDITRTEEIKERSMLYEGLKHYFIVRFAQRAGALREFLEHVLGPTDDIVFFEYTKKNSREKGGAIVGLELKKPEDFDALINNMKQYSINYEYLNNKTELLQFLI